MPPRRLRIFAALCCALALGAACRRVELSDPTRPLLVLLVSIDTLRADHLRSYGGPVAAPNIEALAADGVLYRAAFSHSPQTLPSHASL
jgi:predicted AlkP superfamily pyrophosphatase or phosphodiesterase